MPNSQLIKRLELSLDRMLSEGYTTLDGFVIAPDRGWIEYKRSLPGADSRVAIPKNAEDGSFAEYAVGDDILFSVREFPDGQKYVDVDVDQHLFDGLAPKQMQLTAAKIIRERFAGKVVGTVNTAFVNVRAAKEYEYPKMIRCAKRRCAPPRN